MIQVESILETKKIYTGLQKVIGQVARTRVSDDCKIQILSTTKMAVLITIISKGGLARFIAGITQSRKKSSQICTRRKIPPSSRGYRINQYKHCKAT
jgi:hypothetical protein